MLLLLLLSCQGDVGIIKRLEEETGQSTETGEPSEDPVMPTTEPSYDPERSGITGYNYLGLRQVSCPACVGESQEITIEYKANFHQPSTNGWTEWIPSQGACTTELIEVVPSTVPLSVGGQIMISNPQHQFQAQQVGLAAYENNSIWEPQIQRDAPYEVTTEFGSYTFFSSHGYDWVEPYTMLWVDPSYAFDAAIYRTGAAFSWAPTSTNHTFTVTVAVYSWDGSQFLGQVTCAGADSGFMQIPAQHLQQYPAGSLTAIHLIRHKVELVETEINNSYVETHTQWEVVGTGHIE